MTIKALLITFCVSSYGYLYSQAPGYPVEIDSSLFTEQVTFTVEVGFGDSLNFQCFTISGYRIAHLSKRRIYQPKKFVLDIDSMTTGTYISSVEINAERIAKRLIRDSRKQQARIILDVRVRESPSDQLVVYPNPASFILHVEIMSLADEATLEILDPGGKKRFEHDLTTSATGHIREEIDISVLDPGQYFIRLSSRDGSITRRFIKDR
ncbi:MAG: T9SS type A sorting domain-containing protein [Cytophagales bacterium]|nr:T9SS type A sorting domain-containing protein [Cytophagales bacterium]